MHVVLATARDLDQVDADHEPLAAALERRGLRVSLWAWDDPQADWAAADLVLLRSTWNYHLRRDDFLAWAERVARRTRLENPYPVLRWNTHKFYLRELARRGLPIVPTEFIAAAAPCDLGALLARRGWERAVVKPAVSADSFGTIAVERATLEAAQRHLVKLCAEGRDVLVQRYLPAVEEPGERCLVFLDGACSHAIRKRSLFLGGRWAGPEGLAVPAAEDELELARRVLERAGCGALLYARVDLLRDDDGRPCLAELELAEPSLFLGQAPGSADRLAAALEARLASRRAAESHRIA